MEYSEILKLVSKSDAKLEGREIREGKSFWEDRKLGENM